MTTLVGKIACAIAQGLGGCNGISPDLNTYDNWVRKQVGPYNRSVMTYQQMVEMMTRLGYKSLLYEPIANMPDTSVYYTDEQTMEKIAKYLTYPADDYIAGLDIDCDDYARWASADARRIFRIQGVFEVWGTMPQGYHAWNVAIVGLDKVKFFDANAGWWYAGDLFNLGDHGYVPEKWQ